MKDEVFAMWQCLLIISVFGVGFFSGWLFDKVIRVVRLEKYDNDKIQEK